MPPLNLPIEKGAVPPRPAALSKFVDPDEAIFRENTKRFADLPPARTVRDGLRGAGRTCGRKRR